MRRVLDRLYALSGGLAAAAICGICLIVAAQVTLNLVARIGGPGWSLTIPSYADFSGYLLATASFLALAHTLRAGGHVRVTLLVHNLPRPARLACEAAALALALAASLYGLYYLVALVEESHRFGDRSHGIVSIPLWAPQSVVAAGLGVFCIALADTLVETLRAGGPVLPDGPGE